MNTPAPPKLKIAIPKDKIADFCRRWKISEFALFGSVLRDDFRSDSDLDVLVTFASDARWGLFALYEMQQELKKIFGREVDLVSRRGIEASRNYIRRKAILKSAEVVYVTGFGKDCPAEATGAGDRPGK
jgi:predicted nucleotidyltransferase